MGIDRVLDFWVELAASEQVGKEWEEHGRCSASGLRKVWMLTCRLLCRVKKMDTISYTGEPITK